MDNFASGSRLPQPFPSAASSSRKREEELVYMFEAEEERITNQLERLGRSYGRIRTAFTMNDVGCVAIDPYSLAC